MKNNNVSNRKKFTLADRLAIETGLCRKEDFKKIAKKIGCHPASVSREIRKNRTMIRGIYPFGNDCKYVKACYENHLCGDAGCMMYCYTCSRDCHNYCPRYVSVSCHGFEKAPYVCNACSRRKNCTNDRYVYSSRFADDLSGRRRSDSRRGIRLTDEQFCRMDELVSRYVKQGQPLSHICVSNPDTVLVSERTLYSYIDQGLMSVRNIDLRRKAGYRKRRKKHENGISGQGFRQGRTYADFQVFMQGKSESIVAEMDTVKGKREKGQVMLTLILRRNSVMLIFLMPDCRQQSVRRCIDFLEEGLGHEAFRRLFGVLLTDNGSEFKDADSIEMNAELMSRTSVYYCDPMASWQKPHIEKNHEYIRYVIPKGRSFNRYTQDDITLLTNHINSTRRESLDWHSPYEMVAPDDRDMQALMALMRLEEIAPDRVCLSPALLEGGSCGKEAHHD